MAGPENIVLGHLCGIRDEMRAMRADIGRLGSKVDDLQTGQQSLQGIPMAVGHPLCVLDHRVESREAKIGGSS